jgi:hypothetical protein
VKEYAFLNPRKVHFMLTIIQQVIFMKWCQAGAAIDHTFLFEQEPEMRDAALTPAPILIPFVKIKKITFFRGGCRNRKRISTAKGQHSNCQSFT